MASLAEEIWRPVVGHPFYEVSNLGRVRSLDSFRTYWCKGQQISRAFPGRVLVPGKDYGGYLLVNLEKKLTRKIHHLVLEAFVGPRPDGHETNHIDGNKANNCPENLEWVLPKENTAHAFANRLRSGRPGMLHHYAKVSDSDVREIRKLAVAGVMQKDIAKRFGISRGYVSSLKTNLSYRAEAV